MWRLDNNLKFRCADPSSLRIGPYGERSIKFINVGEDEDKIEGIFPRFNGRPSVISSHIPDRSSY